MKPFKFFRGYNFSATVEAVDFNGNVRRIRARWTPEVAEELQTYHGIDIESELTELLSREMAREIDNEILRNMFDLSNTINRA